MMSYDGDFHAAAGFTSTLALVQWSMTKTIHLAGWNNMLIE